MRVYCHFSFKRPKGKEYGLFSTAFYSDFEGKKLITKKTRKYDLWKNHQFVTAIQSYEHALQTIYELQGQMSEVGVTQVMLVTENSTLAGWIENPNKNKRYSDYMNKAAKLFRVGEVKALRIGVGLCEPREREKSYKYCKEENVENTYLDKDRARAEVNVITVPKYRSVMDIVEHDMAIPSIQGIQEIAPA